MDSKNEKAKQDRLTPYLKKYLDEFVFDSLAPGVFEQKPQLSFAKDVPLPFRREDLKEFLSTRRLNLRKISENMIWVLGCDPLFPYAEAYSTWLKLQYGARAGEMLLRQSDHEADEGRGDRTLICMRAALVVDPDNQEALYSYGVFCTQAYQNSDEEEYIGRFKAEAMEAFEKLSVSHPDFAPAYYYLGYQYLNMGLYTKASLTWKMFMSLSDNDEELEEIQERIEQLIDHVEIERGCNEILANRWQDGLQILEPYVESNFANWWPLHYYTGLGFARLGKLERAEEAFMRVLGLNPTHQDTMNELVAIYEFQGNTEKAEKYRNKAEMLMKEENEQ